MQTGDRVLFHFLDAHKCGGVDCKCVVDSVRQATVVDVWPQEDGEPLYLKLALELQENDWASPEQLHVPQATTTPPESGTWTRLVGA